MSNTLLDIVNGVKAQIEQLATSMAAKLAELNAARDGAIAAAATARNAFQQYGASGSEVFIYMDAINGDDTNDGKTPATAIKTWAQMGALLNGGLLANVELLTDIVADSSVALNVPPPKISLRGVNAAGVNTNRKITFIDDPSLVDHAGGFRIRSNVSIQTTNVDIEMAYASPRPALLMAYAFVYFAMLNGTFTRTGTGQPMFGGVFSGHFHVVNSTIAPSAAGHVIQGVVGNSNPNAIDGISSNFTQG